MDEEIKKYADSGNLNSLRYIFVDALDVDPTFADYEEDYNYCKAKGILEPHCELTPFTYDQSKWTRDYWAQLKVDLVENFSDERMSHMRQVAKVYLADKIKRLEREEQARRQEAARQAAQTERVAQAKPQAAAQAKPQAAAQTQSTQNVEPAISKAEAERLRVEARKKEFADEEKQKEAKRREEKKQHDEARQRAQAQAAVQAQSTQGRKTTGKEADSSKKVIGVVAITVVVIGIVLFLILGHNPN